MKGLEKLQNMKAYEVKENRFVKELDSQGVILEHKKTGAKGSC